MLSFRVVRDRYARVLYDGCWPGEDGGECQATFAKHTLVFGKGLYIVISYDRISSSYGQFFGRSKHLSLSPELEPLTQCWCALTSASTSWAWCLTICGCLSLYICDLLERALTSRMSTKASTDVTLLLVVNYSPKWRLRKLHFRSPVRSDS